jgi:hypothetical protein
MLNPYNNIVHNEGLEALKHYLQLRPDKGVYFPGQALQTTEGFLGTRS